MSAADQTTSRAASQRACKPVTDMAAIPYQKYTWEQITNTPGLSGNAKLILLRVQFLDSLDQGGCWASNAHLAQANGISHGAARGLCARLKKQGRLKTWGKRGRLAMRRVCLPSSAWSPQAAGDRDHAHNDVHDGAATVHTVERDRAHNGVHDGAGIQQHPRPCSPRDWCGADEQGYGERSRFGGGGRGSVGDWRFRSLVSAGPDRFRHRSSSAGCRSRYMESINLDSRRWNRNSGCSNRRRFRCSHRTPLASRGRRRATSNRLCWIQGFFRLEE